MTTSAADTVRRVTYPHMGAYHIAFKAFAQAVGAEAVTPPYGQRQRTLEIGARLSPEFVCIPFKYNVGDLVRALENGANVIVQAGGGCRFACYAETQEQILRDAGYEFDMVALTGHWTIPAYLRSFKNVNPRASYPRVVRAFALMWAKGKAIEAAEEWVRLNVGFERERGETDRVMAHYLDELDRAATLAKVARVRRAWLRALHAIPLDKPADPIRVGVVGELFVVMDDRCNAGIERAIADHGIEVHRHLTLTRIVEHAIFGQKHLRELLHHAAPYLEHHLGAHGTESVALTCEWLREGFDGVVHVKPFGCMPEVSAMSALQRISREHCFPILFLSYDTQTAEAGIRTRIEAFCDMLKMRRGKGGRRA